MQVIGKLIRNLKKLQNTKIDSQIVLVGINKEICFVTKCAEYFIDLTIFFG